MLNGHDYEAERLVRSREPRRAALAARLVVIALLAVTVQTALAQANRTDDPVLRAAALLREGKVAQAEAELNAVLAGSPKDADALSLLGVVRAQQGRMEDAAQLFRRALAANPKHLGANVNYAELLLVTKKPQLALEYLRTAHAIAPDRADVNVNLAEVYLSGNEPAPALEHLKLVPPSAATFRYYSLLFDTFVRLRRADDARKTVAELRESAVGDASDHARFAMRLAGAGMSDEALGLLEAARVRAPDAFPLLYALGVVNATAKRFDKAEEHLTAALRAKPDDVSTLRALARVARAGRNLEKALAHLVHARRVAPASPGVLFDFGAVALEMDLLLDALPAFERLHSLYPAEPAYVYALAATRLRKGEKPEAARLMNTYVEMRPKDAAGFYLLGVALHSLNQFAEARVALERSLALGSDPETEYRLGLVLYDEGSLESAVEMLRRVVAARPEHAGAHSALGTSYRDLGDTAAARVALERAVALDPNDLRAHYQLGLVYGKLGEKEAAKKMLDRAEVLRGEQRKRETVLFRLVDPPQN